MLAIEPDGSAVLYLEERAPLGDPMSVIDSVRGADWDGVPEPRELT
ncbi:hypothetical protein [Streptomyces tendae]